MKQKLILTWLILFEIVFFMNLVQADTTFFEGELGDEFIMVNPEENIESEGLYCGNSVCDINEDCSNCIEDCGACSGGGKSVSKLNDSFICDSISKFFEKVNDGNFSYTPGQVRLLTEEINQESEFKLSDEKISRYIDNFGNICEKNYFSGQAILSEYFYDEDNEGAKWILISVIFFVLISGIVYFLTKNGKRK